MCTIPEIKNLVGLMDEIKTVGIIATDPNGVIVYINKTVLDIYGYSQEELLGQKPSILKSGYHPTEFYKTMWETIVAKKVYSEVLCNKSKDQKDVWEHLTIVPIIRNNAIENYIAIIVDATEQRKNKLTLESLLQSSPDFIMTMDAKLNILQILPDKVRIANPFLSQYVGKNATEYPFITEEHLNNIRRIFSQIDENPEHTYTYVFKIITSKGLRIFQGVYTRYNADKYMVVVRDVTNEEVTVAELNALLGAISDLIIIFDTEGTIMKIYNGIYPYYESSMGLKIVDLWAGINPVVGEKLMDGIKTVSKTRNPLLVPYTYTHDEVKHYYEARFACITENLVLCTSRNITTSRQAELMEGLHNSIQALLASNASMLDKIQG